jgi:16S rRNA C967 or C1407 C5-methylase (RsmB/RsmF family)
VSLRRDQLIPVKKAVNTKEQLEKGLEEEEEKNTIKLWRITKVPNAWKLVAWRSSHRICQRKRRFWVRIPALKRF